MGGVNQVVINLATEMDRAGSFKPIFLIDDWDAPKPVWEKFGNVPVVRWRVRTLTPAMSLKQRIMYALWMLRFRASFKQFCLDYRVAAINLHYPGANAFSLTEMLSQIGMEVPVLLSYHGTDLTAIETASAKERKQWMKLAHDVKAVVACSNDLSRRIHDIMGQPKKLVVIHNGVNAEAFISQAARLPSDPAGRVILSIGKFDKQKGQDVLIKTFCEISSEYPDLTLVLLGASGPELHNLQRMCETGGITSRVSFLCDVPHEKIANYFSKASIFVLPSRQEAFGIVVLEAGCFALPVIASKVGGIPEIIDDTLTGLLVNPDRPGELAKALRSVLNDPAKGRAMGQKLRLCVIREFTWTRAHDQYVRLVNS
ncbi:hypothetical protein B2J86_09700 [Acidovorax sp. SRB_14]|nr:hypothetical protein [Acidovorax sp. SRB_14]